MADDNAQSMANGAKVDDWSSLAAQLGNGNEQAVLLFQQSAAAAMAAGQGNPLEIWQAYMQAGNQGSNEDGQQLHLADFASVAAAAAANHNGTVQQSQHTGKTSSSKGTEGDGKGENVQDLMHKVQKRLQQNRESAKKCRQRKKQYIHQLEEQLAQLRAERDQAMQSEVKSGHVAGHVPGDLGPNSHATGVLMPLLQHREQLLAALQALQHAAENRQDCKPGLNQCLALLKREDGLRKQCATRGLILVLSGQHLPPEERIISWMGGMHPSVTTRTLVQQLQGRDMLNASQKEQLERLAGSLLAQEEMVNAGQSQILSSLLMTPDAGQVTPEVMGRMSALRMFLTNAEEIRKNYYSEIEKILTPEQLVLAVLLPYQLIMSLQRLIDPQGPNMANHKGPLTHAQAMPLVFQGLHSVMPGGSQGVPQQFSLSSLDPASVAAMALQQVHVQMMDHGGHGVVQHPGQEEGAPGARLGSKRSSADTEDARPGKAPKLEHDTAAQAEANDKIMEAVVGRSQLMAGLTSPTSDGITGMTLTGQMVMLSPVGMQHTLPPGSGGPLGSHQGPIVTELRVEPLRCEGLEGFNGRAEAQVAPSSEGL